MLKSSKQWMQEYSDCYEVLDPDGWNRMDFENSWNEPITFEEFCKRLSRSTLIRKENYQRFVWK